MLSQSEAIAALAALFDPRPLIVADIGSQSCWLKQASHHPRNLYLSGPMGMASSVALGLALARPQDHVLALCGDGALAMNLSSLITMRSLSPPNLTCAVLVNDVYDFTAATPAPSAAIDWLTLGAAIFPDGEAQPLEALTAQKRARFIVARVAPSASPPPGLGMTPGQIAAAFAAAL